MADNDFITKIKGGLNTVFGDGAIEYGNTAATNAWNFVKNHVINENLSFLIPKETKIKAAKDGDCNFAKGVFTTVIPSFCGRRVSVHYVVPMGGHPNIILALKNETGTAYIEYGPEIYFPSSWTVQAGRHAGKIAVDFSEGNANVNRCFYVRMTSRGEMRDGVFKAIEFSGAYWQFFLSCTCSGYKSDTELEDIDVSQWLKADYPDNLAAAESWIENGSGFTVGDTSEGSQTAEKQDPTVIVDTIIDDMVNNTYEGELAEQPTSSTGRAITVKQALDMLYMLVNGDEEDEENV